MSRRPIYTNPAAGTPISQHQIPGLQAFHHSLPSYAPTPLVPLPSLAQDLGVRAVFVKDESNRFGLPSFKVLGASWGCYRAITALLDLPATIGLDGLANALAATARDRGVNVTVFAATEGNHGRAVAFIARLLGIRAEIYIPRAMDAGTKGLIAKEGAGVRVVDGCYDAAVGEAAAAARAMEGGVLVQDTGFEGYEEVPGWIVEGYSTMMAEVEEQVAAQGMRCDVMVTPVGVGSLAHAVTRHCKAREDPVSVVAVEPDTAACLYVSLRAGEQRIVSTSGTIMDGMNCGTVSTTAWDDLQRGVDAAVTVSSYETHSALQSLAEQSVMAGPCGGASLAALRRLSQAKEATSLLNRDSVVVLLSTEGPRPYQVPRDVSMEDSVGLTQALIQINSSNPSLSLTDGAGESEIVDYLAEWFAHRDIEYHKLETVPGRPSIVGVLRGTGGGQSIMLNGHVDTVSLTSYEKDPLSGALGERNGKQVVLGRGSLDMKSGLAAAMAALCAIKTGGKIPRGDVIIAAVSDEEDGSQGTQDLIAAGWRADAAVIMEPTGGEIITAHKGFLWVEVDILGVASHGSDPSKGEDAIMFAGWFLRALEQYQSQLPVDDTLGTATLHCGLIQGGEEPSSYPAKCTVTVEFRTIPCQTDESILRDTSKMLKDIAQENPRFRYAEPRITMSRPTQKLSLDHPLVTRAVDYAGSVLGEAPKLSTAPFWCDAALLTQAGVPSIVYGPIGDGLHGKEEWVEVQSLRELEGVYTKLIQEFCQ